MRSPRLIAFLAAGALPVAGAVIVGSCHDDKSHTRFRSDTSEDMASRFSLDCELDPPEPELQHLPYFIVNQEARKVIRLRQGMRATFRGTRLDEGARLHFAGAVRPDAWSKRTSATRLSISVRTGDGALGEEVKVVELRPAQRPEDRAWVNDSLDLSRFAGRAVALEFRASGLDGPDDRTVLAGFGNPLLLSSGRDREGDDALIVLDAPHQDLIAGFKAEWASGPVTKTDYYEDFKTDAAVVGTGKGRVLLEMPPGSRVEAPIELIAGAALDVEFGALGRLGHALHPGAPETSALEVEFRVTIDGRKEPLLSKRVPLAEAASQRLHRHRVRLGGAPGGRARVRLETAWVGGGSGYAPLFFTRATILRERPIERTAPAADSPNVILVFVDTLRADHLGCYGYSRPTSPTIDRLAAEGLLFRNCTAASSWTVPSTTTLLTGLAPLTHGAVTYERDFLVDSIPRGAEWFQERGITTAAFVTNPWINRAGGFHRGFDEFQELVGLRAEDVNLAFENWLDQNGHHRFFAYLHYLDPHAPYGAPRPFLNQFASPDVARALGPDIDGAVFAYDQTLGQGRRPSLTAEQIAYIRDLYDGEIRYFDEQLGKLLKSLENRALLENTLIVFTADHGEAFLEHGLLGHEFDVSEEVVHVPLIFWYPRWIHAAETATPAATEDVLVTLAARLRLSMQEPLGTELLGRNLLAEEPTPARPVFTTTDQGLGELLGPDSFKNRIRISAVRLGNRKLVRVAGREAHAYFRLDSDPGETIDASGSEPDQEASLRSLLDSWLEMTHHPVANYQFIDEETRRRLEALGYLKAR